MGTTKSDLMEAVFLKQSGLTKKDAAILVEATLDVMREAFARGEEIKISGFGKFVVRAKGERMGRNPKTGEAITIAARRILSFHPSPILKAALNGRAR